MRFLTTFITAALASTVFATQPSASSQEVDQTEQELNIPPESVLGTFEFKDGQTFAVGEDDDGNHLMVFFTEPVDDAKGDDGAELNKRWGWKTYRFGSPMVKREDGDDSEELNKRWGWKTYRFGSPMVKREDEGELNKRWGWKTYRFGSPMVKREDGDDGAQLNKRWGWKTYRFGSPMV